MKNFKALLVIALSLGLISCTESIAPGLEEANNGGGGGNPTNPGANILKSFSVDARKHKPNDSTIMHKANQVGTEKCKIEAISLDANAPVYQDCVVDVEELDLYFNGLHVDIQVTDKLCEYVAFLPYKFYSHPVGESTGSYTINECDVNCSNYSACGTHNPPPPNACQFNHGDGAQCDTGNYEVTTTTSVFQLDDDGNETTTCDIIPALETVACGGDILMCVRTPNPEILGGNMEKTGVITKVESSEGDGSDVEEGGSTQEIFSVDYAFEAPIQQEMGTNTILANFSNRCSGANPSLNEQPGMNFTTMLNKFHRRISNHATSPVSGTAMAASPISGRLSQPLYLAQCLNRAGDVKAEIRFVVREWDRPFVQHTNPAILSYVRVNGWLDTDMNSQWNQFWDIDDQIEFTGKNYYNNACHTANLPLPYDPDHFFYNNL